MGWTSAAAAVLVRPRLWPTAVNQAFRMAPRRWWRRKPYLPVPDPAYLRFRLQTQYGTDSAEPSPDDLVAYLEWCRSYRDALR